MKTLLQIKQDILYSAQYSTSPPTGKQAWYCAKLLSERGANADSVFEGESITKKSVSALIDLLIKNPTMFVSA